LLKEPDNLPDNLLGICSHRRIGLYHARKDSDMPPIDLFAATGESVARLSTENGAEWSVVFTPANPGRLYAGTFDRGLFRSLDAGSTWQPTGTGIPHQRVLSVAFAPARNRDGSSAIYAGTEPSNLYRSEDDGASWQELTSLTTLPSAPTWSFPPRPYTSHVRWIATHPSDQEIIYAGIELGGVMVTRDGGLTWEDRKPGSYHDCHALATHAAAPDRVYEASGGGVSVSVDSGLTWNTVDDGLGERRYVWGLAVDAADPDLWYVSAAHGPATAHRNNGQAQASLFRKRGSQPWQALTGGLATPLPYMPYALFAPSRQPGFIYAGFQHGEIWRSNDAGDSWEQLPVKLPSLLALTGV
jgi:photosystem II stability/assembly factor-like uncharacterized protein